MLAATTFSTVPILSNGKIWRNVAFFLYNDDSNIMVKFPQLSSIYGQGQGFQSEILFFCLITKSEFKDTQYPKQKEPYGHNFYFFSFQ